MKRNLKPVVTAALLVFAATAMAQTTPPAAPASGTLKADREQMKADHEKMKADREKMKADREKMHADKKAAYEAKKAAETK